MKDANSTFMNVDSIPKFQSQSDSEYSFDENDDLQRAI